MVIGLSLCCLWREEGGLSFEIWQYQENDSAGQWEGWLRRSSRNLLLADFSQTTKWLRLDVRILVQAVLWAGPVRFFCETLHLWSYLIISIFSLREDQMSLLLQIGRA
jgi:hypothetical protein